jgi:ribulose kinase
LIACLLAYLFNRSATATATATATVIKEMKTSDCRSDEVAHCSGIEKSPLMSRVQDSSIKFSFATGSTFHSFKNIN